jgi:hypothetical protein
LGIKSKWNYRPANESPEHERAYEYGGRRNLNIFVYHDYSTQAGKRTPDGKSYFVISLPNSYERPFETASKGGRRKMSDLAHWEQGNRLHNERGVGPAGAFMKNVTFWSDKLSKIQVYN